MSEITNKPDFMNIKHVHEFEPRKNRKLQPVSDDGEMKIFRNEHGKKHREDGPAVIGRDPETGKVYLKEWWLNGNLHRVDDPAELIIDVDTQFVRQESWYKDGLLHNIDSPARIFRDRHNKINAEEWWVDGKLHREGKPAFLNFFNNYHLEKYEKYTCSNTLNWNEELQKVNGGVPHFPDEYVVWEELYYFNGRLHREDGPAHCVYNIKTNKIYLEKWYLNGKLHRDKNPAWIVYDVNTDAVLEEKYHKKGRKA